jgi:HSP20 family protein
VEGVKLTLNFNQEKEVSMSNLTRWEPVRQSMTLREAMDHLFDEAFTHPFSLMRDGGSTWASPAIDMYQTDHEVVVKAALPGIKADEVQINVTGDTTAPVLTLKGEMKQAEERKDKTWHVREQRWGAFERSIQLPGGVIADKAKADFNDGILTITLPKSAEAKPRTITVKPK